MMLSLLPDTTNPSVSAMKRAQALPPLANISTSSRNNRSLYTGFLRASVRLLDVTFLTNSEHNFSEAWFAVTQRAPAQKSSAK